MISAGTLYWIKPDGEVINISEQRYNSHGDYIVDHYGKSFSDNKGRMFNGAFAEGWIRIRIRTAVAGVELRVPSVSFKAVKSLKEILGQLPSSMSIAIQNDRKVADSEVYSVNKFFKVYRTNSIKKIIKLSEVQKFREDFNPSISGKLIWIKETGEIVDVTSSTNHGFYAQSIFGGSFPDSISKAFIKGWIRVRNRDFNTAVELRLPSVSRKAIRALKGLIKSYPVKDVILDRAIDSLATETYSKSQFLSIYKSDKMEKVIKLSNVQKFREMKAIDLIDLYLSEGRVREAIPFDELEKRLVNLYKRFNGEYPDKHYISNLKPFQKVSLSMGITLPVDVYLPGIEIKHGEILVHDFEREVLKNTGWKVVRAVTAVTHHPGGIHIVLTGIKSLKARPKPPFLYHAAPAEFEKSILRKGLIPKRRMYHSLYWNSEPRIYMWSQLDEYEIKLMMNSLFISEKVTQQFSREYTVFSIDTDVFDRFNIFNDPTHTGFAVYTLTHIPPEAIKVVYKDEVGG